jgi:hypothetical protein
VEKRRQQHERDDLDGNAVYNARMRSLAVVVCLLGASVAHADPRKDVESAVRDHIDKRSDGLAPKAKRLLRGDWSTGADYEVFHPGGPAMIEASLDKVDVVADDVRGFAWFHGKATFTVSGEGGMSFTAPLRINGIATKEAKWKIVAIGYSEPSTDKDMFEFAKKAKLAAPTVTVHDGDKAIAKTVADWFKTGLAAQAAKGNVIANGTAVAESGSGPAALKLVGGWDKLKLGVYKVTATPFAGGEAAFVRAAVAWTTKQVNIAMVLSAVVVKEGGAWKWVSLSFADYTLPDKPDIK